MVYDDMIYELKKAADKWREEHPLVPTFETRYDLVFKDAADTIHRLAYHAADWEKIANYWRNEYAKVEAELNHIKSVQNKV